MTRSSGNPQPPRAIEELESVSLRVSGDAGDGMLLAGTQFTLASAHLGNHFSALPDFPAEIRAPAGTLAGVFGYQVHFSAHETHTPGDLADVLLAMNPAALRANIGDLKPGGMLLVNRDAFVPEELQKAGYLASPLTDGSLRAFRLHALPLSTLHRDAVAKLNLVPREVERCRPFFVLGVLYWLFERPLEPTLAWIRDKYSKNPPISEASVRALKAGHHYAETAGAFTSRIRVARASVEPGRYRRLGGFEALALGLLAAARRAELPLVFASSPLTMVADLLHQMCEWQHQGARVFQAEDEIAAINAALGAAFGGAIGVTATTGPGMSLCAEALGLAVMAELPLVAINIQRGGPSTGLPTKTEQADLLQALFGRHGECPLIVLAARSPAEDFEVAYEAVRLAIRAMSPVIVLADANLVHGVEPWRVPAVADLPPIEPVRAPGAHTGSFEPYGRDEKLVRPWATPGTPGLEHRTGGLEKEDGTGDVSYDPHNHARMVQTRAAKIAALTGELPPVQVQGPDAGDLLVLGWGSTYGAIQAAALRCQRRGHRVATAHLRYLNPLPANLGEVLRRYKRVLVPELNGGQLSLWLRANYLIEPIELHKVQGRPFLVSEIEQKILSLL